MAYLRELSVEQTGRDLAGTTSALALETDETLTGAGGGDAQRHGFAGGHGPGGVSENLRRYERRGRGLRRRRAPAELLERHAVAVGGEEVDLVALDLDTYTGEHRKQLVTAGRHDDLGHGAREVLARDRTARLRHLRQLRVVVHRQQLQREAGGSADELEARPRRGQRDRLVRQGAGDVGQQAPGDQGDARLGHLSRHGDARGGLVVEAREDDGASLGLDE